MLSTVFVGPKTHAWKPACGTRTEVAASPAMIGTFGQLALQCAECHSMGAQAAAAKVTSRGSLFSDKTLLICNCFMMWFLQVHRL